MTLILTYVAQATHDLVPEDTFEPVLMAIANHFVSDRSSSEVMAVGLNAIREICTRCPNAMNQTLLEDLVQYRKYKDKSMFSTSHPLWLVESNAIEWAALSFRFPYRCECCF